MVVVGGRHEDARVRGELGADQRGGLRADRLGVEAEHHVEVGADDDHDLALAGPLDRHRRRAQIVVHPEGLARAVADRDAAVVPGRHRGCRGRRGRSAPGSPARGSRSSLRRAAAPSATRRRRGACRSGRRAGCRRPARRRCSHRPSPRGSRRARARRWSRRRRSRSGRPTSASGHFAAMPLFTSFSAFVELRAGRDGVVDGGAELGRRSGPAGTLALPFRASFLALLASAAQVSLELRLALQAPRPGRPRPALSVAFATTFGDAPNTVRRRPGGVLRGSR